MGDQFFLQTISNSNFEARVLRNPQQNPQQTNTTLAETLLTRPANLRRFWKCHLISPIPVRLLTFALFLVLVGLGDWAAGQQDWTKFEAPKGKLKTFGSALDLIEVKADEQKLKPSFVESSEEGLQKFGALRSKLSVGGGGSSTSGNQAWSTQMQGSSFSASAGFGIVSHSNRHQSSKDTFWIRAAESGKSRNELLIEAKEDGTLSVDLTAINGEVLFRFRQSRTGIVYCQELSQTGVFSGAGQSFDDFCQRHPDYVQKRLEPIFTYIGLGAPPNRYSDIVARNVLAELRPADKARLEKFKAAIEGLNADNFEEREKASQSLQDSFSDWQEMIQTAIDDTEYPVETRVRLRKIFKNSVSEKEVGDLQIAQKGKLEDDVPYLIWLLGRSLEEDFPVSDPDKNILIGKLEKLTGIKNGNDLDKWKKWNADNQTSTTEEPKASISTEEIVSSKGMLEQVSPHIEKLIRLKYKDGRLAIDRDHWAKPFDGKTIEKLAIEAQEMVKEKGLPSAWFKPGGDFPIESTSYPQVLFEAMKADIPSNSIRTPSYYSLQRASRNREIKGKKLTARLGMHQRRGNSVRFGLLGGKPKVVVPKEEYLEFEFVEQSGDKREFSFRENKDGSIVIAIEFPEKDALIRIVQNKTQKETADNKFFVFDVRGALAKSYWAQNFLEFKSQEKEYFETVVAPILKKLKVEIDEPEAK